MPSKGRPKRTPQQFSEMIVNDMLECLWKKFMKWKAGDHSAALTEDEVNFIMQQQKIQTDQEVGEATCDYLSNLSDKDLDDFYKDLKDSLN